MNKLNKILLTLSIVLAIAFCIILVLYLNLKSKYNKLEGEILFSQNGQEVEQNEYDGNFLLQEKGE